MNILCVDDEKTIRTLYLEMLKKMLPPEDRIELAASGEEAIERLQQEVFDVVITDLQMTGLSGLDVLAYVREKCISCEVIIVTGYGSIDSAYLAMKKGARDYIEKPIKLMLLVEKLNNLRDYIRIVKEGEEFRLAKDASEIQSNREIMLLEERIRLMQAAINDAVALTAGKPDDELVPAAHLQQITGLLKPFCWQESEEEGK